MPYQGYMFHLDKYPLLYIQEISHIFVDKKQKRRIIKIRGFFA